MRKEFLHIQQPILMELVRRVVTYAMEMENVRIFFALQNGKKSNA